MFTSKETLLLPFRKVRNESCVEKLTKGPMTSMDYKLQLINKQVQHNALYVNVVRYINNCSYDQMSTLFISPIKEPNTIPYDTRLTLSALQVASDMHVVSAEILASVAARKFLLDHWDQHTCMQWIVSGHGRCYPEFTVQKSWKGQCTHLLNLRMSHYFVYRGLSCL